MIVIIYQGEVCCFWDTHQRYSLKTFILANHNQSLFLTRYKIVSHDVVTKSDPIFQYSNVSTIALQDFIFIPAHVDLSYGRGAVGFGMFLFYHPCSQNMCLPLPPSQKLLLFVSVTHTRVHRPYFFTVHIKFIVGWFFWLTLVSKGSWILAVQWSFSFLLVANQWTITTLQNDFRSIVIPH